MSQFVTSDERWTFRYNIEPSGSVQVMSRSGELHVVAGYKEIKYLSIPAAALSEFREHIEKAKKDCLNRGQG